ncbi:MAG: hypothetical protein QOJ42_5712 [Acidobacteriaceae bacterium]|jgi:hypothetical protein|nr:hypothetical protein [Acidobacteriaceae bacterium]
MHSFSSERREDLRIPADVPFYEDATFWNPSWTTAEGAVQITGITDFSKSMEVEGNGTLLSPHSYAEQVGPNLVGLGHTQSDCKPCRQNTAAPTSRQHSARLSHEDSVRRGKRNSPSPCCAKRCKWTN